MLSSEKHVKSGSDYYLYTPSVAAAELMFYPTIVGRFTWEAGYVVHRTHFDSFLLMLDMKRLEDISKWFAYYNNDIYFPYAFDIWQYSSTGRVDGISGDVDMNISFR